MSNDKSLKLAWKTIAALAPNQTAVKAIKRLQPHLIGLGYSPDTVDDTAIGALLTHLEGLKRPTPRAETNSFIRAFNATPSSDGTPRSRMSCLATVGTARADAWAARPALEAETQAFIEKFSGKMSALRLKAGVMRLASAVEEAGLPCIGLRDLLTDHAIAAVIEQTSPNGLDQPSQRRDHALYMLTSIATVLNDAAALAFIKDKKTSKELGMKGHTALMPTAAIDRIARYDDSAERDILLKTVMRALLTAMQEKPTEANLYRAQAALAFLLAFFGGLAPSQIAGCRFDQDDPENGAITTRFQHGQAEAPVGLSARVQQRVGQYRLWLQANGLHPAGPFINPVGDMRTGKDVAHTLTCFLKDIGSNLRPLDVRDFGCSELFRAGKGFDYVRAHLRASSTQNVANRLKELRARVINSKNQEAAFARAQAIVKTVPDQSDAITKGLAALDVDRLSDADHACLMRLCSKDLNLTRSTIARYSYAYRRYLGFLTVHRDRVMALPPAERFSTDHLAAYAALLLVETGKASTLATLKQLAQSLLATVPEAPRDALMALIAQRRSMVATRHPKADVRLKAMKALPAADEALITPLEQSELQADIKPTTRANAIGDYKRFLGVLNQHCPELLALPPQQRITHAAIAAYGRKIAANGGAKTAAKRLRALKLAIKRILPGTDLTPIDDVTCDYRQLANGGPSVRDMLPSASAKEDLCSPVEKKTLKTLEKHDIINSKGAARKATARSFRYCYLEFIACVARHDPALITPPLAKRDLLAMLRCYIAEKQPLWQRSTMTTALTSILRVLSRMLPPADLAPLRNEIRTFHYTPSTDFWVRTVDVAELIALGLDICDTARARLLDLREVKHPYRSLRSLAERYRNGLMILTLGLSALRVTNFSQLAQGSSFNDKHGRYRIAFEGKDVKNRADIRLTLPPSSRPYFDDYLDWIRALIVGADDCEPLWPSFNGEALTVSQIQRIITGTVEDEIGAHVTCHDFRRSAASSASLVPGNPADASAHAIGDRDLVVVDRRYKSPISYTLDGLDDAATVADDCGWDG